MLTRATFNVTVVALVAFASVAAALPPTSVAPVASDLFATPSPTMTAAAATKYFVLVPGHDGHEIPVDVYVTGHTDGAGRAPTLLWGPGWSGVRGDGADDGGFFTSHGYNVVAFDPRGNGDARFTSLSTVHSVDREVMDYLRLIDWIAAQSWAQLDGPGDPVLGALGGSYGGGYQTLTAAFDTRLDAIAPEITWNSLPRSLAPNGVIKSSWIDLLYGSGLPAKSMHPLIHQGFAWASTFNELPDGALPGEPDVLGEFTRSSPMTYPSSIAIPTLIIQGMRDTLFDPTEGIANFRQVQATGAPAKFVTHNTGHVLPGLHKDGGSPCASRNAIVLDWYDAHLKNLAVDTGATITLATDNGGCLTSDAHPDLLDGSTTGFDVAGSVVLPSPAPMRQLLPIANGPMTVAGAPIVSGTLTVWGAEAIVLFSIVRTSASGTQAVVGEQVTPLRVAGPGLGTPFTLDLTAIAVEVAEGESLSLAVSNWDVLFFSSHGRIPSAAVVEGLTVDLPLV